MKRYWLFVVLCWFAFQAAWADSPLTSTPFADAYKEESMIKAAQTADGVINKKLMKYLSNPGKPLEIKMAICNQLGWSLGGRDNGSRYMAYLQKRYGFASQQMDNFDRLHPDELLSLAYLTALDNYFDVRSAAYLAREALKKNPKSYTCQIVVALILAQEAFDTDWCKVYQITDAVRNMTDLKMDMREGAIAIIFDYMDIYADSCKDAGGN